MFDVAVQRVHEPQGSIDRVVHERANVGGVRQHALRHRGRCTEEHLAALVGTSGTQEQPLVRGEQVPGPLAEPRVAGHRRRPRRSSDDELVGHAHEDPPDVVDDAGQAGELDCSDPCCFDDIGRCWCRSGDVGARRQTEHGTRREGAAEHAGSPEVLGRPEPSGCFFAVMLAAVPHPARFESAGVDPEGRLEHEPGRSDLHLGRRTVREAVAVLIAPSAQRRDLERRIARH